MDCCCTCLAAGFNDGIHSQIAVCGCRSTDADGTVCKLDVQGISVSGGIHADAAPILFPASPNDADSNFSSIGNQYCIKSHTATPLHFDCEFDFAGNRFFAVNAGNCLTDTNWASLADDFHLQVQNIARYNLLAELCLVDSGKQSDFALKFRL